MSSYCTITDVNMLVPQSPFTSTTTPTQAQVEAFITAVSNRTDATLTNIGYVTPVVSGAAALLLLKEAVAWGALGLAMQSRITAVAPDQAVGLSVWTKQYNQWIQALADNTNPFELPDAPRNAKAVVKPLGELQSDMVSNSVDSGTSEDPYLYISSPTFSMGMKF
jgi:hypothetical protein